MQTDITFAGCRIWLDGESKRELKMVIGQLERWVFDVVGDPPKFSAIKKKSEVIPKNYRRIPKPIKGASNV